MSFLRTLRGASSLTQSFGARLFTTSPSIPLPNANASSSSSSSSSGSTETPSQPQQPTSSRQNLLLNLPHAPGSGGSSLPVDLPHGLESILNPSSFRSAPGSSGLGAGSGSGAGVNPDGWWNQLTQSKPAYAPGNQYTGRSLEVKSAAEAGSAYRLLQIRLRRSGLMQDVKRSEFHEKPSEKKRRLASVRHRRRFQEMVREKVQMVQMIRNRG